MTKTNNWVWTELAESKIPDRKAGETVPVGFLMEGHSEYYPYSAWVKSGYVKEVNNG
jgi:hypothetical protein